MKPGAWGASTQRADIQATHVWNDEGELLVEANHQSIGGY